MSLEINRDMTALHPEAAFATAGLLKYLTHAYETGATKTLFKLYEGYRSPQRQHHLFTKTKTTKADAWQSAHQYGLAVDLVPFVKTGFHWGDEHDWKFMRAAASDFGMLTPIKWDLAHLEHPLFKKVRPIMVSKKENIG